MPTLVSTGQLTIVDNNDARPITAFITGNGSLQQIYTKDESTVAYLPDWTSSPLTLTAKVYVGGTSAAVDITAALTNRKWSTDLSTSIGSAVTYVINTNVLSTATPSRTYYFEGDYTDPATGFVSHVIAQIAISLVRTGTNAVYIQVNGQNVIEQATGTVKSTVTLSAALMRAAGVDDTGVTYQWFAAPFNASDQIDGNYSGVLTKYGFMDTAAFNASNSGAIGSLKTTAGGTTTAISTSNIPDGGWADLKAITISESAITNIGMFLVKAKDSDGMIYQQYFSVYDVSDEYSTKLNSSGGDKLQNGVGSTTVTPKVYYGAFEIASYTSWAFTWYFYDRNGYRGAFVDTAKIATAGGAPITGNTTGASATIGYSGTSYAFAAGDIVKAVKPDGTAFFYEVASSIANQITIRAPSTNTFLNFTNYPSPSGGTDFVGGKLFGCTAGGTRSTAAAAGITLTGDDVDAKCNIVCEANRP